MLLFFYLLMACTGPTPAPIPTEIPTPPETPATDPASDADAVIALKAKLAANPDDARAHLEMARALSRLRSAIQPCAIGATREEILGHLEAAVRLDPSLGAGLAADADLAPVATTVRLAVLSGADLSQPATRSAVLVAADWSGPPSGVLPSTGTLDLLADGTATGTHRVLGDAGPVDTPFSGTWASTDSGLSLTVDGATTSLILHAQGLLTSADKTVWQNLPSECGA